jgi:hypothetical protein
MTLMRIKVDLVTTTTTHSLNKNHKKPLQRVQDGVEILLIEMFFQLWQELGENLIVMAQKPHQFRKSNDVQSMHGKL